MTRRGGFHILFRVRACVRQVQAVGSASKHRAAAGRLIPGEYICQLSLADRHTPSLSRRLNDGAYPISGNLGSGRKDLLGVSKARPRQRRNDCAWGTGPLWFPIRRTAAICTCGFFVLFACRSPPGCRRLPRKTRGLMRAAVGVECYQKKAVSHLPWRGVG